MQSVDWVALSIFVLIFVLISVLGFWAARWRRGDLHQLNEWGLGGRRFGTFTTWFLVGGDLYTAYTFVAIPALAFGAGALAFYAIPYTVFIYPILFAVFPRLWQVCNKHGYITAGDFVRGRFGNRWLALAVSVTGIVATLPYIALQLVGIQVVLGAMGVMGTGWLADLPLIIAFLILAAFTYTSGLRAPASIAVVKDALIYLTVIVAIIVIPIQLGGFDKIFAAVPLTKLVLAAPPANSTGSFSTYITLALGSAIALFLYPHSLTGILSANSAGTLRRNAALLPGYSIVLGFLILFGFFAIAAGVDKLPEFAAGFAAFKANFAVPALFVHSFPSWFVGIAFAAIGIGALVPAAIMSIAAANLYSRNIHREFIKPTMSGHEESQVAKWASLVAKIGALGFIVFLPQTYAIQLQLLGGVWIIQTLPAVLIGAYTRWFDDWALLVGWVVGIAVGTWMAAITGFTSSTFQLDLFGFIIPGYAALYAVILNLVVAAILTPVFRAVRSGERPVDETAAADYAG